MLYYNGLNERQHLYTYWRIFIDQQSDVAVRTKITEKTTCNLKKNLFAMLEELYVNGISETMMGGAGRIIEADKALLGKKPTYNHGKLNTIFKI